MKKHAFGIALFACLAPATLLAQKVTTDWDHHANFESYQTYMWREGTPLSNPLMQQRVNSAVESELSAKGLRKVESDPDMYVTYHATKKDDTQYQTDSFGYGMGPGWRWGGLGMGGMATSTTRAITYEKGTLVVDLWDAKKKHLIWRGTSTSTLSDNPQKNSKKIHKAMEKLFAKYPPT